MLLFWNNNLFPLLGYIDYFREICKRIIDVGKIENVHAT